MKAIVYRQYGSPDVLAQQDVPKPVPNDREVLVRVRAAALNPFDWHLLRGVPYVVRATAGWRKPKRNIPGIDVAGVVEAVGRDVTLLQPGDEVFGEKSRACSEYVCGAEKLFARKPANLTFEEAAAIPVAAATALQALRDKGRVQPGQRVLINGASGGVGTFAVQLAKAFGAEVTGVCSTPNVDLVRSIGADHVIDYTREDFTRTRAALRPDHRQCGQPFAMGLPARAGPGRDARGRRRAGRALDRTRRASGRGEAVLTLR